MCSNIAAGDTLIIAAPGTSLDSHLWMVISDPAQSHFVLMVNLTTFRADKDQACILDVGDHPFITHRSCVNYAKAKWIAIKELVTILAMPEVKKHSPLTSNVLQKVRDAVGASRIELGHYQTLLEQGVISE